MANVLINFRLSGNDADRFLQIEEKLKSKPGKPPSRTDTVKALMGIDPYKLLEGWERNYLSGNISVIPTGEKPGPHGYDFKGIKTIGDIIKTGSAVVKDESLEQPRRKRKSTA